MTGGQSRLVRRRRGNLAYRLKFTWGSDFDRLATSTTPLTWDALFRSSASAQVVTEFVYEQFDDGFTLGNGTVGVAPGTYQFASA